MINDRRFLISLLGGVSLPFFLAEPVNASKEGGLSLFSVILDSPGMDDSGPVHVEINRSDVRIEKFTVSAFGKKETAPPKLLQSIKDQSWLNGVQLSWEKGYHLAGGRTIYISFTEGGTWGVVVVATIGFSEDGTFRIINNLSRKEVEEKASKIPDD